MRTGHKKCSVDQSYHNTLAASVIRWHTLHATVTKHGQLQLRNAAFNLAIFLQCVYDKKRQDKIKLYKSFQEITILHLGQFLDATDAQYYFKVFVVCIFIQSWHTRRGSALQAINKHMVKSGTRPKLTSG